MKELVQRNRLAMNLLLVATLAMLWALRSVGVEPLETARAIYDWGMKAQVELPKEQQIDLQLVDPEAGFYFLPRDILQKADAVIRLLEALGLEYHWSERSYLVDSTRALRAQVRESGVAEDATFEELRAALKPRVSLSSIEISASIAELLFGYLGAALALLLLLISNAAAMRLRITQGDHAGYDWLFFHPGFLGPGLCIIWLMSPIATLAVYVMTQGTVVCAHVVIGVCYVAGISWLLKRLRPVRTALLEHVKAA